ncbi:MAG TPA: MOSC domain-containing protein [Roseiflexaceae bacterium]|nr:MOSC domain-containing protein [Roseiflexaceae bacterium]
MKSRVTPVGSVVGLWRYPVKSMQGEALDASAITERGLLGDRAYALMDRATGYVVSAKHPRKWGAVLQCRAAYAEPPQPGTTLPPLLITLPDGAIVSSARPDIDQVLSRVLGRDVTLTAEAPTAPMREANRSPVDGSTAEEIIRQEPMGLAAPTSTFFDHAALHVLTTATLSRLQALYPAGRFAASRFRPNILVAPDGDAQGFVENMWLGRSFTAGSDLHLHMIDPSPRCVVTTLAQGELPHDIGILRTVSQHNAAASVTLAPGVLLSAVAGIYARVDRGGMLRVGDSLDLQD